MILEETNSLETMLRYIVAMESSFCDDWSEMKNEMKDFIKVSVVLS